MNFSEAVESGFQNYAEFSGRTPRSGYWWWFVFDLGVGIVALVLGNLLGLGSLLQTVANLALLIPGLAVSARRLHDVDKSGWNILWCLTIVGILYVLYLYVQPGTPGSNRY